MPITSFGHMSLSFQQVREKLWYDGQATENDVYKNHTIDFSCFECILHQQK